MDILIKEVQDHWGLAQCLPTLVLKEFINKMILDWNQLNNSPSLFVRVFLKAVKALKCVGQRFSDSPVSLWSQCHLHWCLSSQG